ncbi:UNVERIFIED_CONTAM: hypothetical protein Sradi_2038800 [Sesamum radiatum]|uniref:Retrotransposon gag domain-containing protein n=1 Tax=Sesamum radiatum TaxID=300843 RepID=A0AAW2THH0_SESRA
MVNSDNRGDNESYKGNSSLPVVAGPAVPPTDPATGVGNASAPDLIVRQIIMKTSIRPSAVLKLAEQDPLPSWREEEHQEVKVTKDTMLVECGIPFNEHIITKELPTHFRASSHLPTYDGTTDPTEHIRKFKHATLLHSKKYKKSAISPFEIKQEENETLKAYIQCFNTATLEVPAPHQEVLVNTFTQELRGGPLFEYLAKKPTTNFLDVLVRAGKYMNLEDA